MSYLKSLFSLKKLKKNISLFALWDPTTSLSETTILRIGSRCLCSKFGKYTRVGANCCISHIETGNFTAIGKNTCIGLGAHPTNYITSHSIFYKSNWCGFKPEWIKEVDYEENPTTYIGNDVWVGARCTVMDGVTIGDGAIIAAGAVVTKDIPPFAIAGGVPAKVIKYRYSEEIIKRLMEIQWWNLPDDEITKRVDLFHIPDFTLEDLNKYFPTEELWLSCKDSFTFTTH